METCPGTRCLVLCPGAAELETTSETSCLAVDKDIHPVASDRLSRYCLRFRVMLLSWFEPPFLRTGLLWSLISLIRGTNEEMTPILIVLGKLLACCFVWLYVAERFACMCTAFVYVCRSPGLLSKAQLHHTHTEAWLKITRETTSSFGFSLI